MRGGIDHLVKNETAALNGGGIECIHQMRVALRRLSATLALFKDIIGSPKARKIKRDLKWLSSRLGRARDWDVLATSTLQKVKRDPRTHAAAERIASVAGARRIGAHRTATRAVGAARYRNFVRTMKTWLADARWCEHLDPGHRPLLDEPLVDAGRPWLGRSARKVRRAGKGVKHLTAKERHRLRIALKQLRYDTNSLSSLYAEKKVRPYVAALCDLQDVLGNLNDLVVARKLVGVGKNRDRTVIDERLRATEAKRLKALAPAWRAFRKIPPFWK
jgi:CHAD domain-containing protein